MKHSFFSISIICLSLFTLIGCNEPSTNTQNNKEQATENQNPLLTSIMKNMVHVEGGHFKMGSNNESASLAEQPRHSVTVNSFYIDKYEVTQKLFETVMGSSNSYFSGDDFPVNNLSWQQANYFIEQLNKQTGKNFRLPTEAEWEYAAQGGNKTKNHIYSGSDNIADVAWYADNANNKAHPVGMKHPNELGLYDMTGNVGEFVIDTYEENFYSRLTDNRNSSQTPSENNHSTNNPANIIDSKHPLAYKSVRGGSYSYAANESENYRRDSASQTAIMADMGLRLVLDITP
ncbi:formylglycine-generating enzyme family protein [Photobacterium profundum]